MDAVREARGALRRDRPAEALVHLWNALEPARLAGDRRRLEAIGGLATAIASGGDEADRAEAERLLEAVGEAAAEPGGFGGAQDVGVASVGGERAHELEGFGVEEARPRPQGDGEGAVEPDEAAEPRRSGVPSLWTILIILFVIITIVRNFVEGR